METNQDWMGRIYLSMDEEPEEVAEALAEAA
jgi:glycyl-tRNA synthetase beta subunit